MKVGLSFSVQGTVGQAPCSTRGTKPKQALEKMVVRTFIYPIFDHPLHADQFNDQFAFRPTGSTTCALVNLNHTLANLLQTHPYVHLIALDFFKAFDTVRHSTLLDKCRQFPILDSLYNCWLGTWRTDSISPNLVGCCRNLSV